MADAIHIPSPSAFLRDSPPPRPRTAGPPTVAANKNVRRPASAEGKKAAAAPRKPGAASAGVDKPKQSKSRNGCQTCKAKRLKCDEEKPECKQCKKRNVTCGGYKKDFKWRPFEETNVKINIDRQNLVSPSQPSGLPRVDAEVDKLPVKPRSADSSQPSTPITEHGPRLGDEVSLDALIQRKKDSIVGEVESSGPSHDRRQLPSPQRSSQSPRSQQASVSPIEIITPSMPPPPPAPPLPPLRGALAPSSSRKRPAPRPSNPRPRSASRMTPPRAVSPTLTEILFNNSPAAHNRDFVDLGLPHPFDSTPPNGVLDSGLIDDEDLMDEELEDMFRNIHPPQTIPSGGHSRNHLSMSDSLGLQDLAIRSRGGFGGTAPHINDTSTDALNWRFLHMTAGIRSIMDGPTENPWRTLVWPLAQESPALFHAVTAMAAFHASLEVPQMRVIGHEHKQASLRFLQEGLQEHTMRDECAIATALALGFSESWDQHTASGNTHIKGAQVLVKRAVEQHKRRPLQGDDLRLLKFLCNAWVYVDVIARLTAVDSDESNDFDNTFLFLGDSSEMADTDGFGIDFGMPIDTRLDPLMGCANTLFPLIGRVANLVRKVCRSLTNSPSVISQASDLKRALEAWEPPVLIDEPEDPSVELEHTTQTAEAYRWATLLHLHQSVPELPSESSTDLAQRVLQYLATVPPESRTLTVQTYPLMVAGCEAATDEDRNWVRERWAHMCARMPLGPLEKSATVTEEVWRRREAYEAQPTTRRKLVATADLQPVRRIGQPLVRTDTGSWGGDPGRTGVVFSYVETENETVKGNSGGERRDPSSNDKNRDGGGPRRSRHERLMDPAYTVRGHLHWVGVMWDWGWEILLG